MSLHSCLIPQNVQHRGCRHLLLSMMTWVWSQDHMVERENWHPWAVLSHLQVCCSALCTHTNKQTINNNGLQWIQGINFGSVILGNEPPQQWQKTWGIRETSPLDFLISISVSFILKKKILTRDLPQLRTTVPENRNYIYPPALPPTPTVAGLWLAGVVTWFMKAESGSMLHKYVLCK